MDKKTDKRGEGISRRDMMATAGIIGAGVTAASMAGGGGLLVPQAMAQGDELVVPPSGSRPREILFDPHSGVVLGSRDAGDGIFRLSTHTHLPQSNVFIEVDMDEHYQEENTTGIEFGGEKGKFIVVNNRLQLNSLAERTLFKTGKNNIFGG